MLVKMFAKIAPGNINWLQLAIGWVGHNGTWYTTPSVETTGNELAYWLMVVQ
jgi:hypothetical protein